MDLLDLLDQLDAQGVTLAITRGRKLRANGPRHAVDSLAEPIRHHRDLLAAHVTGITTGHVLAFCTNCGAPTITATRRQNWPPCRDTPRCGGADQHGNPEARHVPRPVDLERRANAPRPPTAPKPPPKAPTARLLGPRPPWPAT